MCQEKNKYLLTCNLVPLPWWVEKNITRLKVHILWRNVTNGGNHVLVACGQNIKFKYDLHYYVSLCSLWEINKLPVQKLNIPPFSGHKLALCSGAMNSQRLRPTTWMNQLLPTAQWKSDPVISRSGSRNLQQQTRLKKRLTLDYEAAKKTWQDNDGSHRLVICQWQIVLPQTSCHLDVSRKRWNQEVIQSIRCDDTAISKQVSTCFTKAWPNISQI